MLLMHGTSRASMAKSGTLGKMPCTHCTAAGSCSRPLRLLSPMLSDSSCMEYRKVSGSIFQMLIHTVADDGECNAIACSIWNRMLRIIRADDSILTQ